MPIPVQHFAPLSVGQTDPLAYSISQLPSTIQMAQQQYNQLQQMKMQKELFAQQQQQKALEMKYLEPTLQADLNIKQQQSSLPFGGKSLPGIGGEIMAIDMIGKTYGYNSPQYKTAKNAFDLDLQSKKQSMEYQKVLTQTMPTRMLSPTGKGYVEEFNVRQGNSPTGQSWGQLLNIAGIDKRAYFSDEISPYSKDQMTNVYQMIRQKAATDPDARKRNLLASNIEKTLNMVNPDDITRYAGFKGTLNKISEFSSAPFGKESKDYDNYLKSSQAVQLLTSQARQFYGDSIQPQVREHLERLSNPATWANNPKLAKDLFNTTKNILESEMKTYRDAMKGTEIYKGNQSISSSSKKLKYNPSTGDFE